MAVNDLPQTVQDILQQGKIEEALDMLIQGLADTQRRGVQKDAVQLKTNYAQARYQYEVRAVLPRPEFELIQNRTINGIQAILDKLESTDKPASSTRTWWIAGIIAIVVIAAGLWWKFNQTSDLNTTPTGPATRETPQTTVRPPLATDPAPGTAQPAVTDQEKKQEETTLPQKRPKAPSTTPGDKPSVTTPSPPETCSFKLILNGNMIDAHIQIDGKPAQIVAGDGTQVRTIETTPGKHKITLRNNKTVCSFESMIAPGSRIMQHSTCN